MKVYLFVFINFQIDKPAALNNAIKSFFELTEANEKINGFMATVELASDWPIANLGIK